MVEEVWPCDDCGRLVNPGHDHNECDSDDVQSWFDFKFRRFLVTPQGEFEVFYARRRLADAA
jgi:hypothetical protein